LYDGNGMQQDNAEAVKCFRKAAKHSNAEAQFGLGLMTYIGEARMDKAGAAKWWHKG
jgi:TPR repeat protein